MPEHNFRPVAGPSSEEQSNWETRLAQFDDVKTGADADRPLAEELTEKTGIDFTQPHDAGEESDPEPGSLVDPEDRKIAKKLLEEHPDGQVNFLGSPESYEQLDDMIQDAQRRLGGVEVTQIAVHDSCINDHDCIVVYASQGKQFHMNTRLVAGFGRSEFIERMAVQGIEVIEK